MVVLLIPNDAEEERRCHANSNQRCSQGIVFDWLACKHCMKEDNFTGRSKNLVNPSFSSTQYYDKKILQ